VASSRIEGLEVGSRRLLKAQLALGLGGDPRDVTATEVLNNVEEMRWATEALAETREVTVEHLLEIHRRLMTGTRLEHAGGQVRAEQNWIGGSPYNPCSAAFVPPPPDPRARAAGRPLHLLQRRRVPAVAQAAIAHAQFETIRPFADGNGRTGRALVHVLLKRRGLAPVVVPQVSLVLATWSEDSTAGLTATRSRSEPDATEAAEGMNRWIALFAAAMTRAVDDADEYERQVHEIQARWRETVGKVRSDSAVLRLIEALPGAPLVTVQSAAALIDRSVQATNDAIAHLQASGVLEQTKTGKRKRGFEATDLICAFTALERQLASPKADTRVSPPAPSVPARCSPRGRRASPRPARCASWAPSCSPRPAAGCRDDRSPVRDDPELASATTASTPAQPASRKARIGGIARSGSSSRNRWPPPRTTSSPIPWATRSNSTAGWRSRARHEITQNGRRRITLRARMLRPSSGKPIRARCSCTVTYV
jgi:Fic family protein